MSSPSELIVKTKHFDPSALAYQNAKVNSRGGKSVGIRLQGQPLVLSIPLMFTWGVNERVDEASGRVSYDLALVFENEKSSAIKSFCTKLKEMQDKILDDAAGSKSKEWFGKAKLSREVAEAMMYPILKYPKDKNTGELDYSRDPNVKIKVPYWEGKYNIELFDWDGTQTFAPEKDGVQGPQGDKTPLDLVPSKSHIKGLISCNGVWMAGGRFGVTWKLVQARVRKPVRLLGTGVCHLDADSDDDEIIGHSENNTKEESGKMSSALVDSCSDDDDDAPEEEKEEIVEEKPTPKKKKIVRRKKKKTVDA